MRFSRPKGAFGDDPISGPPVPGQTEIGCFMQSTQLTSAATPCLVHKNAHSRLGRGLDPVVVELVGVVLLVGQEVAAVLEQTLVVGRDALEHISSQHAQRCLDPQLVLLPHTNTQQTLSEPVIAHCSRVLAAGERCSCSCSCTPRPWLCPGC
eukprot:1299216-Rhodomonas_salina.1